MSDQLPVLSRPAVPSLHPLIETALRDSSIDVAKLRALMEMQKEMRADWGREEYARAMAACQAEIQPVLKDTKNSQTNSFFARLEKVDVAIRPIYGKYGFSVSYTEEVAADSATIMLVCAVTHEAGHTEQFRMSAPPDTHGAKGSAVKTELHGRGSTNTFLRRYLLCMAFNVILRGMDDDGNKGGAAGRLDTEMVAELRALMAQTQTDLIEMLDHFFKGDVLTLEKVPLTWFAQIKNDLLKKQTKLQKAAGA